MRIFILTDNIFWFKEIRRILNEINITSFHIFCSPKGKFLFEKEIKNGDIKELDVNENVDFLIENFNIGFSCHCKQLFPKELVNNVRCINIHPGLNPYNRGWFPQVFSIINGLPVGVTIHEMDEKIDHGNIILQKEVDIFEFDTSKTLYDRIINEGVKLFENNINTLLSGDYSSNVMQEEGNYNCIRDYKELCQIDLDEKVTMRQAIALLRALTHPPFKNAYYLTDEGKKIYLSINIDESFLF